MTPDEAADFLTSLNTAIDGGVASYRNDRALNPDLSDGQFLHQFGTELAAAVRSGGADMDQVAYTAAAALARLASLTQDLNDYGTPGPALPDNWPPMAGDVWHTFPPADKDGWCAPWEAWHAVRVAFPEHAPEGGLVLIYPFGNEDFSRPSQLLPSDFLTRGEARLAYREWEEDQ